MHMVTSRLIQLYDMGSGNLRVMIMVKSRLIIQLTTWGNGDFKVTLMVLTRLIWGYGNFTIMFLVTTTTGKMVNSRQCPWLRQGLQLMTWGKKLQGNAYDNSFQGKAHGTIKVNTTYGMG